LEDLGQKFAANRGIMLTGNFRIHVDKNQSA